MSELEKLLAQIRAMPGNWDQSGVDRASELADLLGRQGINDLSQLGLRDTEEQMPALRSWEGGDAGSWVERPAYSTPRQQLTYGGKDFGFLGDFNNDGSTSDDNQPYLKDNGTLGWSARGHGNVSYNAYRDAGGKVAIKPEWGSSSDAADIRKDLIAAAAIAAGGYGLNALGAGSGLGSLTALPEVAAAGTSLGSTAGALTAADLGFLAIPEVGAGLGAGVGSLGGLGAAGGAGGSSSAAASLFGPSGYGAGMSGAATGAFDGVLGATGSTGLANAAGSATNALTGSGSWLDAAKSVGGSVPWGSIAGAALGAVGSRDQQQTTNREPWSAAQPLLKSLLDQGGQMQKQFQSQPFTDPQKAAYGNIGGLLGAINGGAGGLMSGFGAAASGANNYDRTNPRKPLTGSNFNLGAFNPALLNFFPGGGG